MSQFIVKGTIKSGVKGLEGARIRVISPPDVALCETTTGPGGSYKTPAVDLEDGKNYHVDVQLADYEGARKNFLAKQTRNLNEGGILVIAVVHDPLKKLQVDPFVDYKNALSKGSRVPEGPDNTDSYFAVLIGDVSSNMGRIPSSDIRQKFLDAKCRDTWEKEFEGDNYVLVQFNGDLLWRLKSVAVRQRAPIEFLKELHHANEGFEWLTYETVINKPKFRKTNQELEFGLYTLPTDAAEIFLRNGVAPDQLDALASAFFPDYKPAEIQAHSDAYWKWKNAKYERTDGQLQKAQAPSSVHLSGVGGVLNTSDRRVVLPYNYYDNHSESDAWGTDEPSGARQLTKTWSFWKTASRSSVVRLKRIKASGEEWSAIERKAWEAWPFYKGVEQRKCDKLASQVPEQKAFQVKNLSFDYASLKTGVCYVGLEDQSNKAISKDGKDWIDPNWIVSILRSDYVVSTEKFVGVQPDKPIVLTEVLSITEKRDRNAKAGAVIRDGVQIRDLSRLSKDCAYVFPGSIPYLSTDYKTLTPAYASVESPDWCAFWKHHWANGLGEAKAMFLMRYGLQHKNPNPQNYLVQFSKGASGLGSLSRIVIRDLQDASVHREVVWALYGDGGAPPSESTQSAIRPRLHDAFEKRAQAGGEDRWIARTLQHEFEKENEGNFQETGTTDEGFGGPGTLLGWARFSTGVALDKENWLKELEAEVGSAERMDRVVNLLADWGMAHAIAYVRCIEQELGVEFRDIDWTNFPTLGIKREDNPEELVAAKIIHNYLASKDSGQLTLRDYQRRRWAPVQSPLEVISLKDEKASNLWRIVRFQEGGTTWYRPTNWEGTIPIYQQLPSGVRCTLMRWLGSYRRAANVGNQIPLRWVREENGKKLFSSEKDTS